MIRRWFCLKHEICALEYPQQGWEIWCASDKHPMRNGHTRPTLLYAFAADVPPTGAVRIPLCQLVAFVDVYDANFSSRRVEVGGLQQA